MAEQKKTNPVHGIVAEYTSVDTLLAAARRIRDAGYKKIDAFTPFPVHGIDEALGIKPTVLPWIALAGGLTGTTTALVMQIFMNTIDYPYIISGKPYLSLPAFMPVAFELTVLFASFGAFFGMLALNGLPRFSNPLFTDPRFDRVTDDRFFLYIDAKDERFDAAGAQRLLGETGSEYIQSVFEDDSPKTIPRFLLVGLAVLIALSIIPTLLVAKMRVTKSGQPRFHVFYDMDFSPAKGAQQTSSLFADGRAMRPDVPGTVARGQLQQDLDFMTGIDVQELTRIDRPRAQKLVSAYTAAAFQDDEPAPTDEPAPADEPVTPSEGPAPAESPAAEEPAVEEKPADKPAEEKPADKPAEDKPAEEKPAEKPAEDKPADKPAEEKPAEETPATAEEMKPEAAEAKPVVDSPAPPATPEVTPDPQPAAATPVVDNTPWLKKNPLTITPEVLAQGQAQFNIYCVVCHGANGGGNGLVNERAQKILATTWTPPSSLHDESLYSDKYADGKLFSTISNGIRKMPGYASQIKVEDRWAIVAYVRALQKSQNASLDLVPETVRPEVEKKLRLIEENLKKQAEQEQLRAAAEKS